MRAMQPMKSWRGLPSAATPPPTTPSCGATSVAPWRSRGSTRGASKTPRTWSRNPSTAPFARWWTTTTNGRSAPGSTASCATSPAPRSARTADAPRSRRSPWSRKSRRRLRKVDPVLAGDLARAIDQLAPMQQACVRLCELEGFTSVEAASMLGISEATVRTHVYRARRRLRDAVDPPREALS